jgi:hypothetical protein
MITFLKKFFQKDSAAQLSIQVDLSNPEQVAETIRFLKRIQGLQPETEDGNLIARLKALHGESVELIGAEGKMRVSRSKHRQYCVLMDYLHDNPDAASLSSRELASLTGVSKSLVSTVQLYWDVNKAAWAEFRSREANDELS